MNNCAVSMNAPGVIWFLCRAQWRFSQIAIPAIGYAEWPAAFAFSFSNIDNKKTHVGTFETSHLSCRQNATHSRDIDWLLNHPLGRPCP